MTKQQEIQLKKGDEIFVKAVFDCLDTDGDAYVRFFWTNCRGERIFGNIAVTFDSVFLRSDLQQPAEKPKYDPCRLFREGDIVTPVERDGREVPDGAPVGEKCTVVESEKNGIVCIRYDAGSEHYLHDIPYFYLELVTPVEELEPYFLFEDTYSWQVKRENKLCCRFGKSTHPHAKEAAEAERDRLNAEHIKEQTHGNQ